MRTLAIDPGINGCGAAWFESQMLVLARYVKNPASSKASNAERVRAMAEVLSGLQPPDILLTECPQIYSFGKGKGDPNKLIPLAQIGAAVAARYSASKWVQYLPREWKGTLAADTMTARILGRLSEQEQARVEKYKRGGLDHNQLDATGIGLFYWGRLAPRKVYPR